MNAANGLMAFADFFVAGGVGEVSAGEEVEALAFMSPTLNLPPKSRKPILHQRAGKSPLCRTNYSCKASKNT